MARLLTLDGSLARASAGVLVDGTVLAQRIEAAGRGRTVPLAPMARDVLRAAGVDATSLDAVCVIVGPGSFTGIRGALALAHGIALAAGRPVVGVTLAEVFAAGLPSLGARLLRTAIDSRRGRVFVAEGDAPFRAVNLDAIAGIAGHPPVAVAGDAAVAVAARLAARGGDVLLTDMRLPLPLHIAQAGARRLSGALAPLAPLPLYVDPPEAKRPAGGLRAAPQG